MAAKVSAEMKHAVMLVQHQRMPVYEAARMAGVQASSLYKALKIKGVRKFPHKIIDRQ